MGTIDGVTDDRLHHQEPPPSIVSLDGSRASAGGSGEVVVSVKNVSKKFCKNLKRSMAYGIMDLSKNLVGIKQDSTKLRKDEFWALEDINFELGKGEALGLIGVNGSGKTTLLRLLAGIFPPDKGEIKVKGQVGALIAVGAGFHPHMTGRENIYLNGSLLGMSREEIDKKFENIVDFAEIGDFLDAPVSTYSSGMRVRLGFSVATAVNPDLLLIDEILAVGDVGFRAKCIQRIGILLENTAVIFVSHDMTHILRICDKTLLLEDGRVSFIGYTSSAIDRYYSLISDFAQAYRRILLATKIKHFSCEILNSSVIYGAYLKIKLTIISEEKFSPDLCLVALSAHRNYVTQSDFSNFLDQIPIGISNFIIDIGPVFLQMDEYQITITIMGNNGKSTIIHAIECASFSMDSTKGYGVACQLPISNFSRL